MRRQLISHVVSFSNLNIKKRTVSALGKYSFIAGMFIFGLLFVSAVKNETRNLEKEINTLTALNNAIKFNLDQAILDNEVITSPENISFLAKQHLNSDLTFYKRSQIKSLNNDYSTFSDLKKIKKKGKDNLANKIKEKKLDIAKLQTLYHEPKLIPNKIKKHVGSKIEKKKDELSNMYKSPNDFMTIAKFGKWSAIQVVKAFLGMPAIPGR